MAKNKSNRQNDPIQENGKKSTDIFGIDAKQIGTAVATILITEIVEAAIQRFGKQDSDRDRLSTKDESNSNDAHPSQNATSQGEERIETMRSSAKNAAEAVQGSLGNLTLNLSDVVDVLWDTGQRLKAKSTDAINTSSEAVAEHVSSGATAVLDRILPHSDGSSAKSKKGNKAKKKNKKKKHH